MEQITRVQIQESLDAYVKTHITDAEWHISLVEDFMHLLTGNSFNVTDLQDSRWIRTIIDNNKDDEYAKKILMRNMPERYISGLFNVVIREINHGTAKHILILSDIAVPCMRFAGQRSFNLQYAFVKASSPFPFKVSKHWNPLILISLYSRFITSAKVSFSGEWILLRYKIMHINICLSAMLPIPLLSLNIQSAIS